MPSRSPTCPVCNAVKVYCTCPALSLWQEENWLPVPKLPLRRTKPLTDLSERQREDGIPYPEILRTQDTDNWLPWITSGNHFGREGEYISKAMFLAHHDPPMMEDKYTGKLIVNHKAVSNVINNLIENGVDLNEPFVDGNTGRFETPLRYAATFASNHQKGAAVTVVNILLQHECGTFSFADTGKFADPIKRMAEAKATEAAEKATRAAAR